MNVGGVANLGEKGGPDGLNFFDLSGPDESGELVGLIVMIYVSLNSDPIIGFLCLLR